jgi:hypothetical protein
LISKSTHPPGNPLAESLLKFSQRIFYFHHCLWALYGRSRIKKTMQNQSETICPSCRSTNPAAAYFCAACGKQLKDRPPATTLSRQIIVYFVSLFLPPFGLWYAWKYIKQTDNASKRIGVAAAILTIISIIITIQFTIGFVSSFNQSLNQLNGLYF